MSYLHFVGELYGRDNFVSADGDIRAARKTYIPRDKDGKPTGKFREYWDHEALPVPSAENSRYPIGDDDVAKLRHAVMTLHGSGFAKQRRFVMLRLLDKTGGRRIELAKLSVASVLEAAAMTSPRLKLSTYKKKGDPEDRFVPMQHVDIDFLIVYINKYRAAAIERFTNDDGFLLINERTGRGLKPNTITLELFKLRKAAGIEGRAHPQQYRHRFITKKLAQFIFEHNIADEKQFSELLLQDVSTFKQELLEYTGHASIKTLNRYVHWAFVELPSFKQAKERVNIADLANSVDVGVDELELMKATLSSEEFAEKTYSTLKAFARDLAKGRGLTPT